MKIINTNVRNAKTLLCILLLGFMACQNKDRIVNWPEWTKDMVIYELTPFQYVDSGGFKGITKDLSRIRNLFFNTIVLQPVQLRDLAGNPFNPSSQFAIQDYNALDPVLGTEKDLKNLIREAHRLGLKILLQWNIEQTGPNHIYRKLNPSYYRSSEKLINNRYNLDYVKFDLLNKELKKIQLQAFSKFSETYEFDGYILYGNTAPAENWIPHFKSELNSEQLILSASSVNPDGISHGKNLNLFKQLTQVYDSGIAGDQMTALIEETAKQIKLNTFIDYETNSIYGTDYNLFPNAYTYYIMFTYMLPGIPWILNGQEFGLIQAINSFNNNSLQRKYRFNEDLFRSLNLQRKNNPALHLHDKNSQTKVVTKTTQIIALERTVDTFYCVGIFNFSDQVAGFKLLKSYQRGFDLFNKIPVSYPADVELKLGPYQAVLFSNVP